MNTAAEPTPDSRIRAAFEHVKRLAPALADTTPRQRIEMIQRFITAVSTL